MSPTSGNTASPLSRAADATSKVHQECFAKTVRTLPSDAQASVAVNSLGLLDLVQIAAEGLAPKSQYRVYLAESNHAPLGKLEALAVLKTNPDGAGIVQAIGPLETLIHRDTSASVAPAERFLVVTDVNDPSQIVLRQASASAGPE